MSSSIVSPSLLYSSPRTPIFWRSSILHSTPRTTIFWRLLQERPYSGDQAWIKPNVQHYKVLYTIVFIKICLDPTKDSWWWNVVLNVPNTTHFDTVRVYLATLTPRIWPQLPQLPQHIVHRRGSSTDLWRQSSRRSFGGSL